MPLLFKADLIVAGASLYNAGTISESEFGMILRKASELDVELDMSLTSPVFKESRTLILIAPDLYMEAFIQETRENIRILVNSWVESYRNR